MRVEAFAQTDVGRVRDHNEDQFRVDTDLGLYLVCDGMGGHAAGEVAAEAAADALHRYVANHRALLARYDGSVAGTQAVTDMLHAAVSVASKTVYELGRSGRGRHGMGTTCVALLLFGDKGLLANVGDSRLYVVRDDKLHVLSTDHNFRTEVVRQGVMTEAEAARSPHGHVLTRAVGIAETVRPDVLLLDVLPGDTFLLCSDGLHEYTEDNATLAGTLAGPNLAAIPGQLVQYALDAGGRDNITAVVVRAVGLNDAEHVRQVTVNNAIEALRELELFGELSMAELVQLYGACTSQRFRAGQRIVQEGETGGRLYVVLDGAVDVSRSGGVVATLARGAHFGEMSLLNRRPRSATVMAASLTTLLCLEPNDFATLLAHDPAIAAKILWKLAQTLSLRLDDAYLARDFRRGRATLGLGEYPAPGERKK